MKKDRRCPQCKRGKWRIKTEKKESKKETPSAYLCLVQMSVIDGVVPTVGVQGVNASLCGVAIKERSAMVEVLPIVFWVFQN